MIAIKVENLSKAYQLGEIGTGSFSRDLERWLAKVRGKEDPFLKIGEINDRAIKGISDVVWSLKNVNFEIQQGDAIGIIGRNGAGKSTLLKILSRITSPTTGTVKARGRIASLLEIGTGFHPELTGKENIFLNGAILGMRKREIARKFDEIVDFSGVERYIDTPVKRYSSGMYVRLAFAVAAHLESEILIVDEVLAVGDAEFQKKCLGKMGEVSRGEGKTVLFVSHNMGSIQQLCNKGVFLKNGILELSGNVQSVIRKYFEGAMNAAGAFEAHNPKNLNQALWFRKIFMSDKNGSVKGTFMHDENIYINYEIGFTVNPAKHDYRIFCIIIDQFKNRVFSTESEIIYAGAIQLKIEACFLVRGTYSIHTFLHKPQTEQIDIAEDICSFTVIDNGSLFNIHGDYDYGKVFGRTEWLLNN